MIVMASISNENEIKYPDHVSEFEVQAELYFKIKQSLPTADVRGEVKSRGTHGLREAKTACRFDLVVYDGIVAVCIVEVKGGSVRHNTTIEDTRQGQRYRTYGVPVIVCYGSDDIDQTVNEVRSYVFSG